MKKKIITGLMVLASMISSTSFAQDIYKTAANVPMVQLNNGILMPQFGLGTFLQPSDSVCEQSCLTALKAGYRHIDTAHAYNDEAGVGRAVKASGIPREEIWITSKLWPTEYGEGKTMETIDKMLERMQLDYIDLLYVHQPVGDFVGAWRDMEKAVAMGKVRTLGISDFDASDEVFNKIMSESSVKPAVIQIECHPYAQRRTMREKVKPYGIQVECWFPLGGAMSNGALFKDPTIIAIAKAHGKTPAQIILRWHIQQGIIPLPKANNVSHMEANFDVFDFKLTNIDMDVMELLDQRSFLENHHTAPGLERLLQLK